jgi:hypothetical protein
VLKRHKKGQLVVFEPSVKKINSIPFITCSWHRDDRFWAYEVINMTTFPSWNDFTGYRISVSRGAYCIVLQDLGMPEGLLFYSASQPDIDVHVYSVLMQGKTVEVFGCDLYS